MRKYIIPILIFNFVILTSCNTTDSNNSIDLGDAIINKTWYNLSVEQNFFPADILEKYSFTDSNVTIDLYPMPCGFGTSLDPIISFVQEYSIEDETQIIIGDIIYEASSISEDKIILHFKNEDDTQTKTLTSKC